ncbi:MAG: FtsX-like permease family protein [Paracoccaceae bacterium]
MRILDILILCNFKHWFRKPLQLFFLFLGISLATTLWSSIQLLNSQAKKTYENAILIISSNQNKIIVSAKNELIAFDTFSKLRRNNWPVTPIIEGRLPNNKDIKIIGIDPFTLSKNSNFYNLFLKKNSSQDFLFNKTIAFASSETINKISDLNQNLTFVKSDELINNLVLVDIAIADHLLKKTGRISRFELTDIAPSDKKVLTEVGLIIKDSETNDDLKQLTRSFHLNLTAFGFLGFIVGLFIVYSTLNLSFEQRKSAFISLRLIGVSIKTLFLSSILEIIFLSSIGGLIGVFFGHILASLLLPDVASTLNNIYGADIEDQLSFSIKEIFIALLMPIFGTIFISTSFLIQLHKTEQLNDNLIILKFFGHYTHKFTTVFILFILLIVSIIILKSPKDLFLSFILITILILSSSLLLPVLLRFILTYINNSIKFKNPIFKWFFSDTLNQVRRISLSLNALMLSIAVTIGVDNMVKSFEETFSTWLDKRLITEMYVRTNSEAVSKKITMEMDKEENIISIYPIIETKSFFNNSKISVAAFKPKKIYIDNWPIVNKSDDMWNKIQKYNGVIINEQFHYKFNVKIGDYIEIADLLNSKNKLQSIVVGIYPDYGNSFPQVMINLDRFKEYYKKIFPRNFAIDIKKGSFNDVSELIQQEYEILDIDITNQATIKEFSKNVFNKTFAVTSSLSDAMIIIATLTLLTSLVSLSEIRVMNLSPLWALGITRTTLLKIEFIQFLLLILITLFFAIPVGLLICFLLTNYLNVSAFGWKLPYDYYPNMWGKTLVVSLLCCVVAIALPTFLMFKNSTSLMIKRYKNEC